MRYAAVKVRKVARAGEFSVFLSGEASSGHVTEVAEKYILDARATGRKAYKQIIFGCVGGIFRSADGGRSARVKECVATAKGDAIAKLRFVHWRTASGNEDATGVQSSGTADQFFERFPPVRLGASITGSGDAGGGGGGGGKGKGKEGQAAAAGPLRSITLQGLSALQAALVFFQGRALLEAAIVSPEDIAALRAELEAEQPVEQRRLELRFGAALVRLVTAIGEFRGPSPPVDEPALIELAEAALDTAIRRSKHGGGWSQPAAASVGGPGRAAAAPVVEPRLSEGLSPALRHGAVAGTVALRLRPYADRLREQWEGDVGGSVSQAPAGVRDDLRRAVLSSGGSPRPGRRQAPHPSSAGCFVDALAAGSRRGCGAAVHG